MACNCWKYPHWQVFFANSHSLGLELWRASDCFKYSHLYLFFVWSSAWIDIHGFWCTVLLHEWCDQEGSPLPQRQTNKNILSSAWKYNILTASFVIPLTSTYMTLSTKWVHFWMILEGRLTGYFNGRQARPMRTLLLDICTVLIEGSCFMSSCHNATWSKAA